MLNSARSMAKPFIRIVAGAELFQSFFDERRRARLSSLARWTLGADSQVDALITTWDTPYLSSEVLNEMKSLRVIAHCGGEVKKRFPTSLFRRLVIVNTPEPMAMPTAELAAAFLLYTVRDIDRYRLALRRKSNRIYQSVHADGGHAGSLLGREVGMIGLGGIGQALVRMLRGFDVRWRIYDPFASRKLSSELPVQFDSLNGVLKRSSLLVVAAAATEKTRGLLNQKRLSLLPDGAVVINIARGSLIELDALTKEVKSGRLRCALDVTDPDEPLPVGHPLRTHPGAMITPHIGGGDRSTRGKMADAAMDELESFFRDGTVQHRVTPSMLNRMT